MAIMRHWMKLLENGNLVPNLNMKNVFFVMMATILCLYGCQSEESYSISTTVTKCYMSTTESFEGATRTSLDSNKVVWSIGDAIGVFNVAGKADVYTIDDDYVGLSNGRFVATNDYPNTGTQLSSTIAIYPYSMDLIVTEQIENEFLVENVVFPSCQLLDENGFNGENFPMIAATSNVSPTFNFRNIGGMLKLNLTGSFAVEEITIIGNSGEKLSGTSDVLFGQNRVPKVIMHDDAKEYISLSCSPAIQLSQDEPKSFIVSLPPVVFENGFTAIVKGENIEYSLLCTEKINIVNRSSILSMPAINCEELSQSIFSTHKSIYGWDEIRFAGDGPVCFIKNHSSGTVSNMCILIPNEEYIYMPIYFRFDENNMPIYMSFMGAEVYVEDYTDSTIDFIMATEEAMWIMNGAAFDPSSISMPLTRAWADNNAVRNACAIGSVILGACDVFSGTVLVAAGTGYTVASGGATSPISVPGIALGVMNISLGTKSIAEGIDTIFGPATQTQSKYIANGFQGIAYQMLGDAIEKSPNSKFIQKLFDEKLLNGVADLGKIGSISYWAGLGLASIDELFGKTYYGKRVKIYCDTYYNCLYMWIPSLIGEAADYEILGSYGGVSYSYIEDGYKVWDVYIKEKYINESFKILFNNGEDQTNDSSSFTLSEELYFTIVSGGSANDFGDIYESVPILM